MDDSTEAGVKRRHPEQCSGVSFGVQEMGNRKERGSGEGPGESREDRVDRGTEKETEMQNTYR